MPTMNVSLTSEQSQLIAKEVESGHFASASEVVRDALRLWREKQIEKSIASLERAHKGAFERDTNSQEMAAILRIQKRSRAAIKRSKQK